MTALFELPKASIESNLTIRNRNKYQLCIMT